MVCICDNEVVRKYNELIDFGGPARSALDLVERYSSRMFIHFRVVTLLFANMFKGKIVSDQHDPTRAVLPWFPDDVSEAEPLLSTYELLEESLLRAVRSSQGSYASWHI